MKKLLLVLALLLVGLPPLLVLALRVLPPPTSAFMLQSETRPLRYDWVPASRIAEVARKAVVASEDQKFWAHDGFDYEAMEEAYRKNKRRRHKRGASTISQQTAKNLFLWPGGGYFRKGIEAYLTVLIEQFWPKSRILEVYLNIAEFGPGIYGVEAAAQAFFRKPAAALTAQEAARLAAVLPNPQRWSAAKPGSYVQRRSAWILGQMGYRQRDRPAPPVEEPEEPPLEPAPARPLPAPAETGADSPATWPERETLPVPETEPGVEPGFEPDASEPWQEPEEMPPRGADDGSTSSGTDSEAQPQWLPDEEPAAPADGEEGLTP